MELWELSASEAALRIRAGDLTALDYARSLDARREAVDPRIHALAHFDRARFLEEAARCDAAIQEAHRDGVLPPPLLGIPIGVKDNIDTAGVPTRAGSALYWDNVPADDAACLKPLWKAGAYLFGKTVTTELAFLDPGPTRNPWDLDHTPGGSSSGAAAGAAAGLFPIALGTQTAGSAIRPAAYCGTAAFVPTRGKIPLDGVLPFSPSLDQLGIFARSAEDLALAYGALTGAGGTVAPLDRSPFFGIGREYFVATAEEEMGRAAIHAAKRLAAAGAIIHVIHLPGSFEAVHRWHRKIMEVEMARFHEVRFRANRKAYGKKIAELIAAGLATGEEEYRRALSHRDLFRAEASRLAGEVDALLLPATPSAAPYGLESTGDPRFNAPWTNAGLPVIALPVARSASGLPLGIQLVGAPGTDLHLLRVALYVEARLGWKSSVAPVV